MLQAVAGGSLCGETIVSVTGLLNGPSYLIIGIDPIGDQQALATSWTSPRQYTDVNITALLTFGMGREGVAYLTTQVGPGTTMADEIARSSFFAPSQPANVTLFSGLTLPAGTYYLVLGSDAPYVAGGWRDASGVNTPPMPSIILDAGVSRNEDLLASDGSIDAYIPASRFHVGVSGYGGDLFLQYSVEAVPEQATLWTTASVLLILAFCVTWARAHDRLLRVARTVADLDRATNVAAKHVAEAVQFR
ncbi:MAG: hypothetical protein JO061_06985, partial [Acidobacteriaceae bacterium]|nr:hypothetical protein [Acidobacteriaceae bacterium]